VFRSLRKMVVLGLLGAAATKLWPRIKTKLPAVKAQLAGPTASPRAADTEVDSTLTV